MLNFEVWWIGGRDEYVVPFSEEYQKDGLPIRCSTALWIMLIFRGPFFFWVSKRLKTGWPKACLAALVFFSILIPCLTKSPPTTWQKCFIVAICCFDNLITWPFWLIISIQFLCFRLICWAVYCQNRLEFSFFFFHFYFICWLKSEYQFCIKLKKTWNATSSSGYFQNPLIRKFCLKNCA